MYPGPPGVASNPVRPRGPGRPGSPGSPEQVKMVVTGLNCLIESVELILLSSQLFHFKIKGK